MSKYIPAVLVTDNHFKRTYYDMPYQAKAYEDYQEALNVATERALNESQKKPISRSDGFEYPQPKYEPIVLKKVIMAEQP